MPDGFFPASKLHSKPPAALVAKCDRCNLWRTCQSPKMEVSGEGRLGILLVGEAGGAEEDARGTQFIGPAGQKLRRVLESVGIDMRKDCWLDNALRCRPPSNATPTSLQIDYCSPNLTNSIKRLNPTVIIPLGGVAVQALIGNIWREDPGPISKWAGWTIPNHKPNCWICPTFHPSYVLRSSDDPVVEMIFTRHLQAAVDRAKGRPWETVPDFDSQVRTTKDPDKAARVIRKIMERGHMAAFDYETTSLKPEGDWAEIVCCSISDGVDTIAYPWMGVAIDATEEFLTSDVPKIASQLKFEDRWTRKAFGVPAKNWKWDTMIAAHTMDNRPGTAGLKFQSFVRLGQLSYDDHIKEHLRSKGGKKTNNVRDEIDLDDLLFYCGLDSLLELKVAEHQMREMGVELQ